MPRVDRPLDPHDAFTHDHDGLSQNQEIEAFKQRQRADFERRSDFYGVQRRKPFHQRFAQDDLTPIENNYVDLDEDSNSGEEGWRDSDGNRLKDYGVDEDVEFYDEDSIPIAELLKRRREMRGEGDMI